MLEIKQLCCVRSELVLFEELNFTLYPGEWLRVNGANGTGKTSLLRIIAGLAFAERGDVLWQGKSIQHCRDEFNQALLYLGHHSGIKSTLTPFENLVFFQQVAGKKELDIIWYALEKVGLIGYESLPVRQLSAGQQRRVALARLWLSQAPLWILDEPLTSIDQLGAAELINFFVDHTQQGGMILLTTHQEIINFTQQKIKEITLVGGEWR